jgi:hypothetical protein
MHQQPVINTLTLFVATRLATLTACSIVALDPATVARADSRRRGREIYSLQFRMFVWRLIALSTLTNRIVSAHHWRDIEQSAGQGRTLRAWRDRQPDIHDIAATADACLHAVASISILVGVQ